MTLPLLAACAACWMSAAPAIEAVIAITVLCIVVVAFTFPWDSWAVRRGVWDFPEDRLLGRIGVLPYEEVAFFVLQTLQVSLFTLALVRWFPSAIERSSAPGLSEAAAAAAVIAVGVLLHVASRNLRARRLDMTYAWHLGIWFLPLILAQWAFGWSILAPRYFSIAVATVSIGTLLTLADVWAVRRGIWFFDERQITGWKFAGILPWEEVAFFYLTSLLVAQSILLFIPATLR